MEVFQSFLSLIFVYFVGFTKVVSATGYDQPFCQDLKPQNSLDVSQIMGMWYGVEIIPHLREFEGEVNYDSCPVVHLSESTYEQSQNLRPGDQGYDWAAGGGNPYSSNTYASQSGSYASRGSGSAGGAYNGGASYGSGTYGSGTYGSGSYGSGVGSYGSGVGSYGSGVGSYGSSDINREFRHIRLYWDESGNNIEYHLKFNTTRRGFWISSGPQSPVSGSLLQPQYNEFAGTVQVLKAVSDHLVLTFCQRIPDSQLFTAILAREPNQLSRQTIHGIHNLLSRRDLSTTSLRKVCRNGSAGSNASFGTMAVFTFLSILIYFGIGKI